jgi:hypothetical protein
VRALSSGAMLVILQQDKVVSGDCRIYTGFPQHISRMCLEPSQVPSTLSPTLTHSHIASCLNLDAITPHPFPSASPPLSGPETTLEAPSALEAL